MSAPTERLVAEALAKSGLLWLTSEAGSAPCWHACVDGVAYVVTGPGEQFCPLHCGRTSAVARAKESRARLIAFEADVRALEPDDEEWATAAEALKAGRLNAPAGDLVARWREEATVLRVTPDLATVVLRGELLPAPLNAAGSEDAGDAGVAAPADTNPVDLPDGAELPGGARAPRAAAAAQRTHDAAERADAQATPAAPPPSPPPSPEAGTGDDGGAARVAP